MNKFKILWKAVLSVFFVCCIQTYSQAQEPCALPAGLDIITTLSVSGPGFCEYDLSLDADTPIEQGVYCADWFYGGSFLGSGPLTSSVLIECDGEPLELCARVYCCDNPDMAEMICEPIIADCCADPCEPLSVEPILINVSTPNIPCELRLELSGVSSYCKEWYVDGVLFSSGIDENSFVLTGCENDGPHEICVRVFCCDTGETVWSFCDMYVLECEPCPCYPTGPMTIFANTLSAIDCTFEFNAAISVPVGADMSQYCYNWYFDGLPISTADSFIQSFDCNDNLVHEICLDVFCCETGEILGNHCIPFTADCECPCDLPADFQIASSVDADNCDYTFEIDPSLISSADYCVTWSVDGGPYVSDLTPEDLTLLFDCEDNGGHFVCARIFCCDNPDLFIERCVDVFVDCYCPCDLPTIVDIAQTSTDGCNYRFDIDPTLLDLATGLCAGWSLDGGPFVSSAIGSSFDLNFDCEDNGAHVLCVRVFCCDDPTVFIENCIDFIVDCPCPCEIPTDFQIASSLDADNCEYTFEIDPSLISSADYCVAWSADGGPYVNDLTPGDLTLSFDCEDNGGHYVCARIFCCDNPDVFIERCVDFLVDCACLCEPLDGVTIVAAATTVDCTYSFTANLLGAGDPSLYCYDWTLNGIGVETTATILNTFECDDNNTYDICVRVYCCDTGEVVGENCIPFTPDCECPCDLPADFQIASYVDADNCDYTFEIDPSLISSVDYCVTWSLDGGPFVSDLTPGDLTLSFDCEDNGGHYVCARIFCCDNPDVFIERCVDFEVACECPCELPDSITVVYDQQGACDHHFSVDQTLTDSNSNLCIEWRVDGGSWVVSPDGWNFNLQYDCYGNGLIHEVCARVFCCDDPNVFVQDCVEHDSYCDCPCELPTIVNVVQTTTDECNYRFDIDSALLDPATGLCAGWSLDGAPFVLSATGSSFDLNFDCEDNGAHVLCVRVFCCDDPTVFIENCIDFIVDCPCPCDLLGPDEVELAATTDGCEYTFMPHVDGQPLAHPYCWWWIYDDTTYPGGVINADGSLTIDFTGICAEFEIGTKVYCCDDEFPAGNGSFATFNVDCCCDPANLPIGDLIVDEIAGSCSYAAVVNFPAGTDTDHLCFNWTLDGVPVTSSTSNFNIFNFDCTENGWHLICVSYTCCENPGEPIEICTEIFVDCPCTHPFLLLADVVDCRVCLTPVYEGPCPAQVMSYDYGDGQTGIDPCHEYNSPGIYTACLTTCCTSNLDAAGNPIDLALCETICTQVVIETDCCELPVDPQIFISKTEDCLHFFELSSLTASSDNLCVEWSLDFGPWQPSNYNVVDFQHQFNCQDVVNHNIRVRIFCCDNPDEKVIVEQDFEINCSCVLPSSVFFNHTIDEECQLIVETTWTSDYCGNLCYDVYLDGVLAANNTSPVTVAQGSGVYNVCVYVYCCDNPNEQLEYCEVIEVNCEGCPCDIHAFWQETAIGNNLQFTDFSAAGAGTTIDTWSWNFGDPGSGAANVSSLQHPSHFYANAGTYTVTLTVCGHDENGVECCDTFVWDVSTECFDECKIEASLDYYFVSDNDCSIQFLDQSTTGVGTTITSWFWDFGDGTFSTFQNPVHTYPGSGVYSVTLTVTGWNGVSYCESLIKREIEVQCDPIEPCLGDPYFKHKKSGCAAKFYDYSTAVAPGIITNITWDFGDGSSPVSGPSVIVHNFPGSGTYAVTVTITIWNGFQYCQLTYLELITVNCGIIINNDNPQGLVINDLNVYPNPTSDKVMIDVLGWDLEELVNVKVMTVTGEVVKTAQFDFSNGPLEVSLDEFEAGLYNISVSNNREILTSRVVKE